jgi:Tfp pilus assembly protein PilN
VTPYFTINFRREMYRQQLARTRRRMLTVGVWLAYFGVLAVVLGLYGLNCASLTRRTRLLEAQNQWLSGIGHADSWKPAPTEMTQAERALANPRRWGLRLARLAAVLPANVALTSVAGNPENTSSSADQEDLVISGTLRPLAGQDRMQGIMALVSTLHSDSVFAAQYRSVRLVESRIGGQDVPALFRIECRR